VLEVGPNIQHERNIYTTLLWVQMVNDHCSFDDHYMANYIVINIKTIFIWLGVSFLMVLGCLRDGYLTILGCPGIGSLHVLVKNHSCQEADL